LVKTPAFNYEGRGLFVCLSASMFALLFIISIFLDKPADLYIKEAMPNKINISPRKQKLIVYIFLIVVTLAVFWQVNQYSSSILMMLFMSQRIFIYNLELH